MAQLFFYKDYDDLLAFCKVLGMDKNVADDSILDMSEDRLKAFLSVNGHLAVPFGDMEIPDKFNNMKE